MAQSKPDAPRKTRIAEGVSTKHKQLEAYALLPDNQITTPQGVVIPDNHNSLRAGVRGPTLAQDFILREKLLHFAHERTTERALFARGCAAHGYFECHRSLSAYTRADFLQENGQRTPVFVRFSNLTGERGSADTVRDVRGFAVKFYTREGNYDLVGASLPVFFVQDAMKLPDLMHALRPEPHHGMPQASSAHDTFWDFASLLPETTHMLMWLMSPRALPRSLRMMEGWGVHTWRFINAHGASHWVKFHWRPRLGRHGLCADEARQLAGCDPDFLRRDLWEAIAAGQYPEWDLGVQIVNDGKLDALGVDLLDATKLLPEELVPMQWVGRLVLNRNPDSFFAETEQVAFNPGNLVPGIGFSNDPLLQGRLMGYSESQITRLGGPNYAELPINRPVCPVHAFQRDGRARIGIGRGAVAYEPNTLATGAEFRVDGGQQGYQGGEEVLEAASIGRRRSPQMDDHFGQARLFWNSQGPAEREHVIAALQHELARLDTPAIRQRVVDNLAHVDAKLARKVAEPLGIEQPDPRAAAGRAGFRESTAKPPLELAPSLSIETPAPLPSNLQIATRRVAILVADGAEIGAMKVLQQALHDLGATTHVVASRLGFATTSSGQQLPVDYALPATSSVFFDAVLVPGGAPSAQVLRDCGDAMRFLLQAYRHCKPICLIGEAAELLSLPDAATSDAVPGVIIGRNDPATRLAMAQEFVQAIARHRHWSRPGLERIPA